MTHLIKVRTGSIHSGSMLPEDLIPAFMEALDEIREELAAPGSTSEPAEETMARVELVGRIDDILGEIEERLAQTEDFDSDVPGYYDGEEAGWDLESLADLLQEFAPPYHYFGAHPGDGADFGFWFCSESFEEDCRAGEVIRLATGDEWPEDEIRERSEAQAPASYVAFVSDHGNVSLWEANPIQPEAPVWDIV